jgi:hypothetical protein
VNIGQRSSRVLPPKPLSLEVSMRVAAHRSEVPTAIGVDLGARNIRLIGPESIEVAYHFTSVKPNDGVRRYRIETRRVR